MRHGIKGLILLLLLLSLNSCRPHMTPTVTSEFPGVDPFEKEPKQQVDFASAAEIEALSQPGDMNEYVIGPGDILSLDVWHRPEISVPELIVGPDGLVTIPRIGEIRVAGMTRSEANEAVKEKLADLYSNAEATLTVRVFRNNRAYVLGRVRQPGIVHFPGQGNLIEAISLAGGIPTLGQTKHYATHAALIRGNSQIYWIDLDDLLNNGNMSLNATIRPNDVVFIPEEKQALVYVMGEVFRPGAMVLARDMTFWDALMLSGGPTEDANLEKTFLVRWDGQESHVKEINLQDAIVNGTLDANFVLEDNDIIYVAERGIARWNYYIRQITPTLRVISLSHTAMDNLPVVD